MNSGSKLTCMDDIIKACRKVPQRPFPEQVLAIAAPFFPVFSTHSNMMEKSTYREKPASTSDGLEEATSKDQPADKHTSGLSGM